MRASGMKARAKGMEPTLTRRARAMKAFGRTTTEVIENVHYLKFYHFVPHVLTPFLLFQFFAQTEGQGTQHFQKGSGYDKFIGTWVDDKRHDEVIILWFCCCSMYCEIIHIFLSSTLHQGYLYFETGDVFVAEWNMGVLMLPCSVLYANGDKYVGDWSGKKVPCQAHSSDCYNLVISLLWAIN